MKDFQFHRPTTVAEAVALMAGKDGAKFLSGGQSLLPVLKLDLAEPTDLISLTGIAELREIRVDGQALVIGALVTHDAVARSADVRKHIPGLAALAGGIGDPQVRNRGTLGGSVAHADPSADYPAAILALGATVHTNLRKIDAEEFFTGLFESALAPGELVTAVSFPIPKRAAYAKFAHRASKYALVGVMVALTSSGVRVAVTGAGAKVFRVSAMEDALTKGFVPEALSGITVSADDLNGDAEASAEFRAHLIGVMAKRAVAACQ
ncbi:MAG: xanthine dehydrogenase family protein subunit M [Myxococcales bacterium]|jgi:carbon-monoxide dehydrogenase medium subunit|nr:xanthine dehydrogenase family protein subunit M [Myxococcales bacterium]HRC55090.1 xanthine dehydrogenase family protein subunit M [Kofleriaceae bacterium]